MLRALLNQLYRLPLKAEDVLLFIGDYVDRGENSCGVIDVLLEVAEKRPNSIFLRGNHEQMMLDARASLPPEVGSTDRSFILSEETSLWLVNGGEETLMSYSEEIETEAFLKWWELLPDSHWNFIKNTRMEHVSGRYHFVHAGLVPPGEKWHSPKSASRPRPPD